MRPYCIPLYFIEGQGVISDYPGVEVKSQKIEEKREAVCGCRSFLESVCPTGTERVKSMGVGRSSQRISIYGEGL